MFARMQVRWSMRFMALLLLLMSLATAGCAASRSRYAAADSSPSHSGCASCGS